MSKRPKVTIMLASRNGAEFISQQLESYRAQTYPNWELVLSDDGSTDGTLALVHEFEKSVSQRVVLLRGPQLGFWQNFASLVRSPEASGELFGYSDQDDVWFDHKLADAVAWFEQIPQDEPALFCTRTQLVTRQGEPMGFSREFARAPGFANALVQNLGGGNTMIFNRAARLALQKTPPEASMVAHDWWTYQVITGVGGRVHFDPRPSLAYRQHGQNVFGKNVGIQARLTRALSLASGQMAQWNEINLKLLNQLRDQLRPENVAILDLFARARTAWLPMRLWLLWRSGVYRQTAIENLALTVAAIFGRI
ncbi:MULTISPECIES: glycosyltransferase family 2 protein [unclassified Bradyrhizobium]|uniref:glycosyltransferase family 2 protein n=1 Tax=unclassified Bradyrhizobium TaxID=2631580 RepID=UPI001FFB9A5D|nr:MULTISPECIES: glycosyltransferase family 2 protein [unclassified Bradyrhizobium]